MTFRQNSPLCHSNVQFTTARTTATTTGAVPTTKNFVHAPNQAAPSSFSRPHPGFKSSLRKIPSVLFMRSDSARQSKSNGRGGRHQLVDVDETTPTDVITNRVDGTAYSSSTCQIPSIPSSIGAATPAETKKNPKARKALASIFSWGLGRSHSKSQNISVQIPVTHSPAPTLPPKDGPRNLNVLPLGLVTSDNGPAGETTPFTTSATIGKSLFAKSSSSALSSWASSLCPPATVEPEILPRPSCGDDPFGRPGTGARVVSNSQVFKTGIQANVKSIGAEQRSLYSVKPRSDASVRPLPARPPIPKIIPLQPNGGAESPSKIKLHGRTAQKGHNSSSRPMASQLPSASFGRVLNPDRSAHTHVSIPESPTKANIACKEDIHPAESDKSMSMVKKGTQNIFAPPSSPQGLKRPAPDRKLMDTTKIAVVSGTLSATLGVGTNVNCSSTAIHPSIWEEQGASINSVTSGEVAVHVRGTRFGGLFSVDSLDVPRDLQEELTIMTMPSSPEKPVPFGLPPRPSTSRVSPRRRGRRAPPPIVVRAIPPNPLLTPGELQTASRISPHPPHLSLDFGPPNDRESVFSDFLSPIVGEIKHDDKMVEPRKSFDFTEEYANLDCGEQRASFFEALHSMPLPMAPCSAATITAVATVPLVPLPPSPLINDSRYLNIDTASRTDCGRSDNFDDLKEYENRSSPFLRTAKRSHAPFQGQLAFQQHIAETKASHLCVQSDIMQPSVFTKPRILVFPKPPPRALPPYSTTFKETAPQVQHHGRGHYRGESTFSIASMSSLGAPVDSNVGSRDYTNYFENEFAGRPGCGSVGDPSLSSHCPSVNKISSSAIHRAPVRRPHHRRSSSILSVDWVGDAERAEASNGPPISMYNARRASYVSRHRRDGSGSDSSILASISVADLRGRSDWAIHKRNISSTDSTVSFSRIGRPDIGDRMFNLDGGVQLTSIIGSPLDDNSTATMGSNKLPESVNETRLNMARCSLASSDRSSSTTESESIFGGRDERRIALGQLSAFCLKGARPVSTISTASGSEIADDTFINVAKYAQQAMAREQDCLQASGELTTPGMSIESNNRQPLPVSLNRPPKPRSSRRRPAHLVLSDTDMGTPGLTSPSASETSSRMSLETRLSEPPSMRNRSYMAHHRKQSSITIGVKLHATIREEPSIVTLRAEAHSSRYDEATAPPSKSIEATESVQSPPTGFAWEIEDSSGMRAMKSWLEWEREAGEEYRNARHHWHDSDESKMAVMGGPFVGVGTDFQDFRRPTTNQGITEFLAQSSQAYQPLHQLPQGRIAHRRKSSLSASRITASPYSLLSQTNLPPSHAVHSLSRPLGSLNPLGLPVPPVNRFQNEKGSLITKFERTQSATSSTFENGVSDGEPRSARVPVSAVFAQFARPLPSSPMPQNSSSPWNPFQMKITSNNSEGEDAMEANDTAVTSTRREIKPCVRRNDFGRGRRHSDGPDSNVACVEPVSSSENSLPCFIVEKVIASENLGIRIVPTPLLVAPILSPAPREKFPVVHRVDLGPRPPPRRPRRMDVFHDFSENNIPAAAGNGNVQLEIPMMMNKVSSTAPLRIKSRSKLNSLSVGTTKPLVIKKSVSKLASVVKTQSNLETWTYPNSLHLTTAENKENNGTMGVRSKITTRHKSAVTLRV